MPLGTFKLAVIEDNPDDIHLLQRLLRPWPIELISLGTGQAALDYLFNAGNPLPDLILLDLILPRMHGFDVLRQIRHHERSKALPVVIATSSAQEKDALKYYQIGVDGFLVKPLQLADLIPFLPGVQSGPTDPRDSRVKVA
jgi:hypothetical protein